MNTTHIKALVKIEAKIEALEAERDAYRQAILDEMRSEKILKEVTDYGTFTRAVRINWTYSEKVQALKDKVKVQEVKEQKTGVAKAVTNEYLRFSPTEKK